MAVVVVAGAVVVVVVGRGEVVVVVVGRGAVVVVAVRVNLCETDSSKHHCVVAASSFGSLIHAAVGNAGGSGALRTKRSGWAA